jgi:VCBS repeat-containing protein
MTPEVKKRYFKGGRGTTTMKQGNGSELLGMNDPRSQSIGIIYVAPNDDRKSILAAILTQEKLGRKQVAVVLPAQQNKAFQRSGDFDDLKSMRRRLQTQIIFIAPPGPGPAEFARQRRFTVYSSIESYKRALQEEKELPGGRKKGLFVRNRPASGGLAPGAQNGSRAVSGQARSPASEKRPTKPEEEEDAPPPVVPFVLGAAAGAAATKAMNEPPRKSPAVSPTDRENTGVFPPLDDEDDEPAPPPASSSSASPAAQAAGVADDDVAGPLPIELPVRRARTTVQLDPKTLDQPAPARASKARPSGTLAAGAAGVAGLAAATAAQRAASGANPPPTRPTPGGSGPGGPRPKRRRRGWLIALLLLLLTLLVVGTALASFPGTRDMLVHSLPLGQPAATVNITPANQLLADNYVIAGVTSTPDPTKLQISAHSITQDAQQQKTVTGTGHNQQPAIQAKGQLTFFNSLSAPQTVSSGTVFNVGGVQVVNDQAANIPAANLPTTGFVTVPAHAVTAGTAGNIRALALNGVCCASGITVQNKAFFGGQDPKNYNFVQQSDVNGVAAPLTQPLIQQAWSGVQKQVASGEQLMQGAQCTTSSSTDQPVGDKGFNVPQATVTVAVKCTANAYNRQQLLDLVKAQLQKKADANLGPGFVLVDNLQTTIKPQTSQDGMISFVVNAKGVWVYQFSDAQKQALAKQIAGKSVKDATALLQSQKGIAKVQISGGTILPSDPTQIGILVQSITGLPASAPPPGVTPTVVNGPGTSGSTAVPGNGSIDTRIVTAALLLY